jgi:hypothetical protein
VKPEHMKLKPVAHQQAAQANRPTVVKQAEQTVSTLIGRSVTTVDLVHLEPVVDPAPCQGSEHGMSPVDRYRLAPNTSGLDTRHTSSLQCTHLPLGAR